MTQSAPEVPACRILPEPMTAQSNGLRREGENPEYLVDNYDLLTAWPYAIHIYFFLGITRLQSAQQAHPGLLT